MRNAKAALFVVLGPMTARVSVMVDQVDNALAVPVHAVFEKHGAQYCYRYGRRGFEKVAVDPGRQNRSLGTRLLREIEAAFPQAERFDLFTGHKSARNLYLYGKLGYRRCREEPVDAKLTIVFLEKRVE